MTAQSKNSQIGLFYASDTSGLVRALAAAFVAGSVNP
jgi:hypothetical protein